MNKETKKVGFLASFLPQRLGTFDFVFMALLVALNIVLERFVGWVGVNTAYGISFVAIIFAAVQYGPLGAVLVSCLGDVLGTVLSGRVPVIGFTVTAAVQGIIYGIVLYKRRGAYRTYKTPLAILPSLVVCSLLMNSYFLSELIGTRFIDQMLVRLPQVLITLPIQLVFTHLFMKLVYPRAAKFLKQSLMIKTRLEMPVHTKRGLLFNPPYSSIATPIRVSAQP